MDKVCEPKKCEGNGNDEKTFQGSLNVRLQIQEDQKYTHFQEVDVDIYELSYPQSNDPLNSFSLCDS